MKDVLKVLPASWALSFVLADAVLMIAVLAQEVHSRQVERDVAVLAVPRLKDLRARSQVVDGFSHVLGLLLQVVYRSLVLSNL